MTAQTRLKRAKREFPWLFFIVVYFFPTIDFEPPERYNGIK